MSKFYSTIQGDRGPATRCGHSGIRVSAQSWDGSVVTNLRYVDDELHVTIATSEGSSAYGHTAWEGSFEQFCAMLERDREERMGCW